MTRYFLAVTLCWLCFWGLYQLLLRRETFFRANRFYLLGTLLLGLLIPLLDWPRLPAPLPGQVDALMVHLPELVIGAQPTGTSSAWSWTNLIAGLYILGCATALVRLLMSAHSLYTLQRQCRREERPGYKLLVHPSIQAPFSFGRQLFWNGGLSLDEREREAVLAHECAHIRHGHSLDILLLEGLRLAFWWCPLWYAYSRSLREVHEYQADAAVLRAIPKRNYGRLLIRQALQGPALRLAHGLKHSSLKHRIAMMTKPSSLQWKQLSYLLVIPLALAITWACQKNPAAPVIHPQPQPGKYTMIGDSVVLLEEGYTEEDILKIMDFLKEHQLKKIRIQGPPTTATPESEEAKSANAGKGVFRVVEVMPVFGPCGDLTGNDRQRCSQKNMLNYVYSQLKYPEAKKRAGVEGTLVIQFIINAEGQLVEPRIARSLDPELDALALELVRSMPPWEPGRQRGKPVDVMFNLPVRFSL